MPYNEQRLISDFAGYLKHNPYALTTSCAIEFKYVKGKKRLNFKQDLQPHQYPALFQTRYKQLFYKISDMSAGQKPFDAFFLKNTPAYLAVCFEPAPRKPKVIHFISAAVLTSFIMSVKSINEATAKEYADFSITI